MTNKTSILIAGIGGVGGYFGGLLAKQFETSEEIEVYFLARGENLKQIQTHGLTIFKGGHAQVVKPKLATDNVSEIGKVKYVILCTKTYDLESVLEQLKPCIDKNTVILPLLNGVDSKDKIQYIYPDNLVLDGCVYIVSRLKNNGVIENRGNVEKLYFGGGSTTNEDIQLLENILRKASIDATLVENIHKVIWEKYVFISPVATATSYFNCCIGKLLEEHEHTLIQLIKEVIELAKVKGVDVDEELERKTLHKIKSLPYEITSSMHSDFESNKIKTELESLTGYVIAQGKMLNIKTETYIQLYQELKNRNNNHGG